MHAIFLNSGSVCRLSDGNVISPHYFMPEKFFAAWRFFSTGAERALLSNGGEKCEAYRCLENLIAIEHFFHRDRAFFSSRYNIFFIAI